MGRQRRLGADETTAALNAFQHRGFFAANIGSRPDPDLHVECELRSANLRAEIAGAARDIDGSPDRFDGVRIFGADINITLGGADGDAGDGHALDDQEWIAFDQHAVGERAAVTLVRVADDVFPVGLRIGDGLPLDAGRETRATAAAQTGGRDVGDNLGRAQCQGSLQPLETAMRAIIVDRSWIDDAASREGQARLAFQPRNVIRDAEPQGMGIVRRCRFKHGGSVVSTNRTECDSPLCRRDFDHRLQPVESTRSSPDDLNGHAALARGSLQRQRNVIRANGDCAAFGAAMQPAALLR